VIQQGILVEEASAAVLNIITLRSTDNSLDEVGLGDFMIRNILGEIRRIPGVGRASLYSTERSLRVWVDPAKLVGYNLTSDDVNKAITAQNAQVASGSVGAEPSTATTKTSSLVLVKGQLSTPEEFGAIVLRANSDGSTVRLRDVARIEIGGLSYQFTTRLNGQPTAGLSVLMSPKGNALATASAIEAKMKELSNFFPANIATTFRTTSRRWSKHRSMKVVMTLIEAVVLVFIVMFIFLQNFRYTMIPTIVVPVALLGTCTMLLLAGYSINMLTMFGMVLAVGILVDDAIVVVENVERIMSEEGLPPKEATKKAMGQISGAIIGITLVMIGVFVPMAFFPGSVGIIYRQFSVTMVASIAFSALLALSLTPALCATFLKPIKEGHGHAKKGVFGWFNRKLDATRDGYSRTVGWSIQRTGRLLIVYVALLVGLAGASCGCPAASCRSTIRASSPLTCRRRRTPRSPAPRAPSRRSRAYLKKRSGIESVVFLTGFSFLGQGMNTAQAFITLKDWAERPPGDSAAALVNDINRELSSIRDAKISALQPPPIDNLGNSSGFSFRLQDRGQKGFVALNAASDKLIADANASPVMQKVFVEGLPPAPLVNLMIDREKAGAFGVTFEDINSTISTNLGSNYINDFPNRGRMQRVVVQSEAANRMNAADILNYNVKNSRGQLVPFSSFATVEWAKGPTQIAGFNFYPAVRISGEARPGFTSGDAIKEMERLAGLLPRGFGFEWTGQSLQEKLSGSQAPFLLALSALVVFLVLAALYESWTIPVAVLMTVPLGIVGAVLAANLRGLPNDVYFHGGSDYDHRSRGQERDSDYRIRQGSARAGQVAGGCHDGSLLPALPADRDDRSRLYLRCVADGRRIGRRRCQPAGAWYVGDRRHDRGGDPGAADGAGVLRVGAAAVLAGQGAEDGRGKAGRHRAHRRPCRTAKVIKQKARMAQRHPGFLYSSDQSYFVSGRRIFVRAPWTNSLPATTLPVVSTSPPLISPTVPPASLIRIRPAAMSQGCRLRSQ
jgi:multidrug efflux pump